MSYVLILSILGANCAPATTSGGSSPTGAPPTLRVTLGAAVVEHSVFFYALAKGFFKDAGVDVTYQILGPNEGFAQAVAGNADLVFATIQNAFSLPRQGKETSIVYNFIGGGAAGFVAGLPTYTSILDCKKMVTLPKGQGQYAWAVTTKKAFNASFEYVEVASQDLMVPSVLGGSADCAILSYGIFAASVAAGKLKLLVDTRDTAKLPATYPKGLAEGGIVGLTDNLKLKRDSVVKFQAAMLRSIKAMRATTPAEIAATLKTNPDFNQTPAALMDSWDKSGALLSPNNGYFTKEQYSQMVQFSLDSGAYDFLSTSDPLWSYERRVDMSYYEAANGKP